MLLSIADQAAFPSNSTGEPQSAQPHPAGTVLAVRLGSVCAIGLCAMDPCAMYAIYTGSSLCFLCLAEGEGSPRARALREGGNREPQGFNLGWSVVGSTVACAQTRPGFTPGVPQKPFRAPFQTLRSSAAPPAAALTDVQPPTLHPKGC